MSEHPQQWLLSLLESWGDADRTFIDDEGQSVMSPTLKEIEETEDRLKNMKLAFEKHKLGVNRYREAAAFLRAAMR